MGVGPLGEEHVREIIPRAISFGHPPPTTVTVTDRHTGHSVHTFILHTLRAEPGVRFSKVPIINGPGKLSPFTLKIEVSIVLHLT